MEFELKFKLKNNNYVQCSQYFTQFVFFFSFNFIETRQQQYIKHE